MCNGTMIEVEKDGGKTNIEAEAARLHKLSQPVPIGQCYRCLRTLPISHLTKGIRERYTRKQLAKAWPTPTELSADNSP